MKLYRWVALAALALTGCKGAQAPEPMPSPSSSRAEAPVMGPERRILALGDSLFAGYGLKSGESYPARLEASLRAHGINARIANAGVSGDTTADGLTRLAFTLNSQPQVPDLVIISLGGNDMLRGLPPEQTRANLAAILADLGKRHIRVLMMGMLAPPNMGVDYRARFDPIYPELAKQQNAALVPFFLQAVIDKPDLVQQDHIHPTAHGIDEIVGATEPAVEAALAGKSSG